MPETFLPLFLLALVSCAIGLLAGRYLWPRQGWPDAAVPGATDRGADQAADQVTAGPPRAAGSRLEPDLAPALSAVEQRLRRSESELAELRAAIRQHPGESASSERPGSDQDG